MEGDYLCSVSTMYRLLRLAGEIRNDDAWRGIRRITIRVAAARFRVDLSIATALGGERFSRLEDTVRDPYQASHHRGDDLFGPLTIGS